MSSFFETELSNLKSVGNTLRKDILRYRKNQEFVQPVSTLYDPANWGSLIDYWPANDDGFPLADEASNDISFPVGQGDPQLVTDSVDGNSVDFDGDDSLNAGDVTSQMPTSAMTLASWIKVDTLPSPGAAVVLALDGDLSSGQGMAVRDDGSGNLDILATWRTDGTDPSIVQVTGLNTGEWYHAVGTYSSDESNLYVNGDNLSDTATDGSGNLVYDLGTEELVAGITKAGPTFLDGHTDEMMIFESALTQSDAETLYQAGV